MRKYFVIGCGGFAKEVYFLAESTLDKEHSFGGFIDHQPQIQSIVVRNKSERVWDEEDFLKKYSPDSNILLFFGLGDPNRIFKVSEKFKGFLFPNLIHPNFIGDSQSISFGIGNIVTAGCVFTVDILVGDFNIFNLHTTVGHDSAIGNCNVFNPGCNVSGGVSIGSQNLFGTNSTILQSLQIGNCNILGAGSLANKSFLNDLVMIGVPAKQLLR